MKLKDIFSPFILIVLGIAFLTVSVWVYISKNKNAIRYKYKIGGMILSLSFFTSSCGIATTCYEPAMADNTVLSSTTDSILDASDSLFFYIYNPSYNYFSFLLTDSVSKTEFQKDYLKYSDEKNAHFIPLKAIPEEYRGDFIIKIFGENSENNLKQKDLIHSDSFTFIKNEAEN